MKKNKKGKHFITVGHDVGTLVSIVIGMTGDEVMEYLRKKHKKVFDLCFKDDNELKELIDHDVPGHSIRIEKNGKMFFFIVFSCMENAKNQDMLLHETIHIKQFEWEAMGIRQEYEFEAYFLVSLYNKIRKEIDKL